MAESSSKRSGDFDVVSKHSDLVSDYDANSNSLIVNHGRVFNIVSEGNPQLSRLLEFTPVLDGERLTEHGTMVSSFHGIVCLVKIKGEIDSEELVDVITLWNPATKEYTVLPPPPPSCIKEDDWWCSKTYGFGYDTKAKSYKLVRFVIENFDGCSMPKSQASVYSVSTDSWKVTEPREVPLAFYETSNPKRPVFNKLYCWLGYDQITKGYLILVFDFIEEKFQTIPVPELYANDAACDAELTIFNKSIAIVNRVRDQLKIWVLNVANKSWTIPYTIMVDEVAEPFRSSLDVTFGFSMNGKLISPKTSDRNIYLFDPQTRKVSIVPTQRTFERTSEVAVYQPTLIPVKYATGVKKRAEYEDLKKKIQDFRVFGNLKPVLPPTPRADVDTLQKEKIRLQTLVEDQQRTISELKKDNDHFGGMISLVQTRPEELQAVLPKLKEELRAKEVQLKELLAKKAQLRGEDVHHQGY